MASCNPGQAARGEYAIHAFRKEGLDCRLFIKGNLLELPKGFLIDIDGSSPPALTRLCDRILSFLGFRLNRYGRGQSWSSDYGRRCLGLCLCRGDTEEACTL
jgi:hypothetical protein